ncbi:MAG: sugar ABC transporter substrate-binding protein [Chloroflexota bacterium]
MSRFQKLVIVLLALTLLVVGIGAFAQGAVNTDPRPYHFIVVTHGQASDPFWSVVKNGVDQAAADMRVTVDYESPQTFDMVAMSQLIDAAVASKPDGLVVSIPDPDALSPAIKAAVAAGIPVVSINSGSDVAAALGVLAHVGQTEYDAGKGGGERMAAAGAKNALCVNQEVGNVALDQRCQGFTDAMTAAGGKVTILAVDLSDPTGAGNRVSAALSADESIDSIFTLGPTGAAPALKVLTDEGTLGKIMLATFDLSPDVLQAIVDGNVLFAIDQQQYMQGYLPIVYLTLYKSNLNTPGNILVPTGPGFVTKDNAARIIELSKAGTR